MWDVCDMANDGLTVFQRSIETCADPAEIARKVKLAFKRMPGEMALACFAKVMTAGLSHPIKVAVWDAVRYSHIWWGVDEVLQGAVMENPTVQQAFADAVPMRKWIVGKRIDGYEGICMTLGPEFENSNNSTRDKAKQLLKKHFSLRELEPVNGIECAYREANNARDRKQPGKREIVDIHIRCDIDDVIQEVWNTKPLRKRCRAMLEEWCDLMERRKTRTRKQADPMERRIAEVCRVLKLNDVEREVLIYAAVRCLTCFDDFPAGHTRGRNDRVTFYAMAIDRPCSAVTRALEAKGKLRSYKVLDNDGDFDRHGAFRDYLEGGNGEMLEGRFYKKVSAADALPWDYYGKLSEQHGVVLKDLIRAAQGRHGVNILLYGAPGTGKTSFAKTLARELGLDLFEIRQGDHDNEDVSPESRMDGIRICNSQVPPETSMVMVDEADQLLRTSFDFFSSLFGGRGDSGTEKGVINTLLDEETLPTIWISNAPARTMDDSVRRRFDYSICFEKLNARQRQMIWRNNVEKLHLSRLIAPETIETLAGKYETSAGGITMVLENVKRMCPSKDKALGLIETLMKPHCKLMGLDRTASDRLAPAKDYSLAGINIRRD